MYNFNILAGYTPKFLKNSKLVPLNLARRRYPRPSLHALQQALNDSIAFLIVRHPLERLLSAYRDKIQFSLPHTLHRKLGNEIVLKYRKTKQKVNMHNYQPSTYVSDVSIMCISSITGGM
jgi:chondroitin 4-sulfotransferase 11